MTLWPIYVPSKGRPDSKLLKLLAGEGLPATFVVEPQDEAAYRAGFPTLTAEVLPENDLGLSYVRRHTLALARERKHEWFWMVDDDITAFIEFNGTKGTKVPALTALMAAQQAAGAGVGQVSLEYQQFAWSAGGKVKVNGYCDVCVGIRPKMAAEFRLPVKGDRDYTMQVIAGGYDVHRVTRYAFMAPTPGSNKGGLHEAYQAGKDARGAEQLVALWPWCSELQTKKNGRIDAKIHWKRVRQKHALTAVRAPAIL